MNFKTLTSKWGYISIMKFQSVYTSSDKYLYVTTTCNEVTSEMSLVFLTKKLETYLSTILLANANRTTETN